MGIFSSHIVLNSNFRPFLQIHLRTDMADNIAALAQIYQIYMYIHHLLRLKMMLVWDRSKTLISILQL